MPDSEVSEMAASVRIEDEAFVDTRIELLGTLAGYNRFEALGRMAHLWRVCTQRDTYVLEEVWISACLGERGPDAIVQSGLGVRVTGGIRVKGTEGRIEWLRNLRNAASAGGRAKHDKATQKATLESASGLPDGRTPARGSASGLPDGSLQPAVSKQKVCPLTPTPSPKEKTPLPPAEPGGGVGEKPGDPPAPDFDPTADVNPWFVPLSEFTAAWVAAGLPGHDAPGGPQETSNRRGLWQLRLQDESWRANWKAAVERAGKSPRCRGAAGPWKLTLDAFLKNPDMATRILEGEFDDGATQPGTRRGAEPSVYGKRTHTAGTVPARPAGEAGAGGQAGHAPGDLWR